MPGEVQQNHVETHSDQPSHKNWHDHACEQGVQGHGNACIGASIDVDQGRLCELCLLATSGDCPLMLKSSTKWFSKFCKKL
jgi:hypothetical protein